MGGAEGGGPRQPPTLQPTDTPGEGLARGDEWGNRQWAPPLTPFLNLSSKHPHSALRSRRWKKFCLLLSPSFCVQAVYGRRWGGGLQMRAVAAWLGNFGNCHFIHTRHCLGEGSVPRLQNATLSPAHRQPQLHQSMASCSNQAQAPTQIPDRGSGVLSTSTPLLCKIATLGVQKTAGG